MWQAVVCEVTKSWTWFSNRVSHFFHSCLIMCWFLQYNKSAICIHIFLCSHPLHHPSRSPHSTELISAPTYQVPTGHHFIPRSVYTSVSISQFIPPTPLPCPTSTCPFPTSTSLFLPCRYVHLYHFSRFHLYVLIYDIWFSLSDLLHSAYFS